MSAHHAVTPVRPTLVAGGVEPFSNTTGAGSGGHAIPRRPDSGPSDRDLFEDLFARRVSDVACGAVQVVSADRQPGIGTVVTVRSTVAGVDAATACTGRDGRRLRDIEAWFPGEHITVLAQDESTDHA